MGYVIAIRVDINEDTNIEKLVKDICAQITEINLENKVISYTVVHDKLLIEVAGDEEISADAFGILPTLEEKMFAEPIFGNILFPDDFDIEIKVEHNVDDYKVVTQTMCSYSRELVGRCLYKQLLQQFIRMEQRALQRGGLPYYAKVS